MATFPTSGTLATGRQHSAPPFARPVLVLAAASGYALDAGWRAKALLRRALRARVSGRAAAR